MGWEASRGMGLSLTSHCDLLDQLFLVWDAAGAKYLAVVVG
jgi:hypothetical protein